MDTMAWRRESHRYLMRSAECERRGAEALDVMERRLNEVEWLVGAAPTIADLALSAYTQRADEEGFDLARWPGVQAWVDRVTALPAITTLPPAVDMIR